MASQKFLVHVDLNKNELQNGVVQNLGTAPSSPSTGQLYYDTGTNACYVYNGTAWRPFDAAKLTDGSIPNTALTTNPLARANHTGTQLAATISDFATTAQGYRLDQFAAPSSDLSINSHKLTNVTDPTNPQDAATKNYCDLLSQGVIDTKWPVRVVATANSALTGLLTIDGVTLIAGDRVALTAQTTGSQNGIYVAASGAWSRATDSNTTGQIIEGSTFLVSEGTTYAGSSWRCTTTGTITIGTTASTWVQFNQGLTYLAGNGLAITGSTFRVNAGNGIIADGSSSRVDPAVVGRKYSASIGDGTSTSYTVNHALGNQWANVQVFQASTPYAQVFPVIQLTDANNVAIIFNVAPTTNQYKVIVNA